jgi:hypothetical protein
MTRVERAAAFYRRFAERKVPHLLPRIAEITAGKHVDLGDLPRMLRGAAAGARRVHRLSLPDWPKPWSRA